eukprot:XP_008680237.1 ADP-ribosylation factor GTPase-activating protein AGD1-like [Zea mays]
MCPVEFEPSVSDDLVLEKKSGNGQHDVRGTHHHITSMKPEKPINLLRKVDGNNMCVDCGASEPDWVSLNLGALLCIECSGVHRNLGVHISKVRSLTLDVRVWEPSVINLFQSLGNMFVNSIWEETLPDDNSSADGSDTSQYLSVSKPNLFMRILEQLMRKSYSKNQEQR